MHRRDFLAASGVTLGGLMIPGFGQAIADLDLQREAGNASLLRRNWENSPDLYVPEVIWSHTAEGAMTMERVRGIPSDDIKALDAAGVPHHDLDYGSYLSEWRRRNALKMWAGWPTFPMVFVKGQLVGGANDLQRLIDSGELKRLLG